MISLRTAPSLSLPAPNARPLVCHRSRSPQSVLHRFYQIYLCERCVKMCWWKPSSPKCSMFFNGWTARDGCHVLEDNLRSPLLSSRCCVGMQMYTLQHKYTLHRVMLSFLHTLERIRVLSEDVWNNENYYVIMVPYLLNSPDTFVTTSYGIGKSFKSL